MGSRDNWNLYKVQFMNAQIIEEDNKATENITTATVVTKTAPASKPTASGQRGKRLELAGAGLAAIIATGIYYTVCVAPYESTDDAFIQAHVTPLSAQIAGRVDQLRVDDNQEVKRGETLLTIDPRDFQARLDQASASLSAAQGRLGQASAQLNVDQAKVDQEKADVIAAEAQAQNADADNLRYQAVGTLAASKSQIDLAGTQAKFSTAEVEAARAKEAAAEAQVALDQATVQTARADVNECKADVRQAELNLSYTEVKAPVDGYITHRTVENGDYIQPGQALLAVVPRQVWVVANFKETQLTRMRAGQPVEVRVDAYPQFKFHGHVDSIQAGSGTYFSLIPPENASGNYVKVVQRVPVKIIINEVPQSGIVLGPGMSVEPTVTVK